MISGWTGGMQACAYAKCAAKCCVSGHRGYVDNLARPPNGALGETLDQLAAAADAEAAGAAAGAGVAAGAAETVLPLDSRESVR